jgi:hypothetical protein
MSFFDVLFLITSLVSFDHCIRGNKKQYIKEGHTIQWSKDTKEVIRNSTSKKDIQYNGQKIQRCSKKQYIKEGHTIQWSKDTKEAIVLNVLL